ncbi:MAG: protoporphyrinogen oxidase [Planctomycetes bacterium]|nr:protoporphyrinogen oxidase [Planctomycetota bacterium]
MMPNSRDVIVVGGGISGLTAAFHLHRVGVDVTLLEANDTVGGCTRTEQRDGFLLEKGPFNVMIRDPKFEELLDAVSDQVTVVSASKSAKKRYIYRHGALGCVPNNPIGLATTKLLTIRGRAGLIAGLIASPRAGDEEETIEQVAVRRFGRDVADTFISSIVSGIFAGDIRKLSLRACFPGIAEVDREARSLIGYGLGRAFGSKKNRKPKRKHKGLVSLDGGLGALTEALGDSLGSNLRTGCRVEGIRRIDDGYEISYPNGDGELETIRCRRLVIAAPTTEAARLLSAVVPPAAEIISTFESSSLVVLNLAFKRADVGHALDGYGFLVPHHEDEFPLMGVLWADSIFPHHAPADYRLVRVFIGGANNPGAVSRSDTDLLQTALEAMSGLLGVSGPPTLTDICRYEAAIPQYHRGHVDKIARLQSAIGASPGLHLTGNYLGGVSVNDCIRVSAELAERLIAETALAKGTDAMFERPAISSAVR